MKQYKRPESVLVLVYTLDGYVLMLERTQPMGFWQSITGSLRWGESATMTARRELFEETGIQAGSLLQDCHHQEQFNIIPPWSARYAPNAHWNTEHWFAVPLPTRRLVFLNPDEHRRYRWVPVSRAAKMASSWTNRKAIQQLNNR